MNAAMPPTSRRRVPLRGAAALVAWGLSLASGQILNVPPAIPTPNGDTAFVGEVVVTFPQLDSRNGNIYYTQDGSDPTNRSDKYDGPILLRRTTTLKSVRYWSGNRSAVHPAQFTRARLPQPAALSGGRTEFATSILCTLAVKVDVPDDAPNRDTRVNIYYTTRPGGRPDTLYTQPLAVTRTLTVTAWAVHPDYDTSLPASTSFRKLAQVDRPSVDPVSGATFSTPTQRIAFASATADAYFLYTTRPGAEPDTLASSVTLEGRSPNQEFTVRVRAGKAGMALSPLTEAKYTYVPKVARPTVAPEATVFTDTQRVSLQSSTAGASIYYTLDGNTPTQNAGIKYDGTPILLDNAYRLRAIASHPPMPQSEELNLQYVLRLTKPTPSQGGGDFQGTLDLKLFTANPKATILYTLDGKPGAKLTSQALPGDVIPLSGDTTHVWAVAVLGGVMSDTARHSYFKRATITTTSQPTAVPEGQDFLGSVTVSLVRPGPDAAVHFTVDGSDPTTASARYAGPITLTSTTVLKAIAVAPGLAPSAPIRQVYGLVPTRPMADPRGEHFANRVEVRLSTPTPGARIYYKTGPWTWSREDYLLALPYPADPAFKLVFNQTTRLTAVAVTGTDSTARLSEPLVEAYDIYTTVDADSLRGGQARALSGAYEIANRGVAPVAARVTAFDDLGLKGFRDPSHAVAVSAAGTLPRLVFLKPGTPEHAVYQVGEGGVALLVGRGDSVDIARPGTYFAALDTLPPVVSLLPSLPLGDSTRVRLQIEDNVRPSTLVVTGSGISGTATVKTQADGTAAFALRNPPGQPQPLWFHATVSDGRNTSRFPKGGARCVVEQAMGRFVTPSVWTSGLTGSPWDMAGFPVGPASALTWGQIRDANRDAELSAVVLRGGEYAPLVDADTVEPGMGFWMGSKVPARSVVLPKFHSGASGADGLYRIALRPGWNLVTNPSFETLYWPAPSSHPLYSGMRVRRLWGFDSTASGIDWVENETLVPWKGYWVHLTVRSGFPDADTVLALSPVPPVPGIPGAKAAASGGVDLRLDFGRSLPVRLGAESYGHDAVDVEDEPALPDWRKLRQAWSARERSRLMTDVVRFRPGEVLRWRVVMEGSPAPGRDSLLRVAVSALPAGYEAWAWSPARNLKVRLEAAAAHSVPGTGPDTLMVFAGPAAKLAGLPELARAVDGVESFDSGLRAGRQGARLFLALPSDALVQADLFSATGRRLANLHSGRLGSGHHELRVPASAPGVSLIRIRVRGAGWSADRVHKLAR